MVAGERRPVHLFLSFWLHFYVFAPTLLAFTKFGENHRFFCNVSVLVWYISGDIDLTLRLMRLRFTPPPPPPPQKQNNGFC